MITIRFRDFPGKKSYGHFIELIEIATGQSVKVCESIRKNVDLEITGPYSGNSDSHKTPFTIKLKRFGYVSITNGRHLVKRNLSTGLQPIKTAKKNIWYSGENVRAPQGIWDGFLTFDTNLPKDRSVYFPLWFLTSTDLFKSTTETYWGGTVPSIGDLMEGRKFTLQRKKFVVAFIGRSYSMRLHAIEGLSKIGKVDVYGEAARNQVTNPSNVATKYRYVMCFENDLYPGYVTEKPLEAYLTGAIPLYFGLDNLGYLNSKAIVNLSDFEDIDEWVDHIKEIDNNSSVFRKIYEQPILLRKPNLNEAINLIRRILEI